MNILIAIAPPMEAEILAEFEGRSVTGHWLNPSARIIVDIIGLNEEQYLEIKSRTGVIIWGAWDDLLIIRDQETGEILVGNKVQARPDIINIVPDVVTRDQDGNETGRERPLVFSDAHKWLGQEDREV